MSTSPAAAPTATSPVIGPVSIGIDLGGTKIACGVLRGAQVLDAGHISTPTTGADDVLDAIATQILRLIELHPDVLSIGIGTPGPLDGPRQRVKFAPNIYGFSDVPVVAAIRERLSSAPLGLKLSSSALPTITLENDARAAALAEAHLGAARGTRSSMYVTVSTGIGSGIVLGGRLWHGQNGIAGEIGHIRVLPGGPTNSAGTDGTLEAVASGTAIARDASYALNRPVSTQEAFALAQDGHAAAQKVVEQAMCYIGVALADLQKVIDPEVFVLGGGVSAVGEYFLAGVRRFAQEYGAAFAVPDIRPAQLGAQAGLIGAALSAHQQSQQGQQS